jgi:hypothetical protein
MFCRVKINTIPLWLFVVELGHCCFVGAEISGRYKFFKRTEEPASQVCGTDCCLKKLIVVLQLAKNLAALNDPKS